jgi:hypothetical protein
MRLWRVTVQCFQEPDIKGRRPMCYEDCIVEALDSDGAMDIGRLYIEDEAPSDVRWDEFTAVKAASIELPMHI